MPNLNTKILQKTLNTNECTKSFFVNYNTLLHVSTLLGHLQGETSVVITLGCTIHLSEDVLSTAGKVITFPKDGDCL
jgi:hypothetical protein